MSAVETSERFLVGDHWTTLDVRARWTVFEAGKAPRVDSFRSRSAAEYAARMLNAGLATINHHAVLGCRVEVK